MNTWCNRLALWKKRETKQPELRKNTTHINQLQTAPRLNLPITLQEVLSAIKQLRKGKSPGPDSITNNLIKGGEEVMALLRHTLHTAMWRWSATPAHWRKALVKPILRPKERNPNYRGIGFSSALTKTIESVLDRWQDKFTKTNDTCTLAQYGSKIDHTTIDALYPLVSHIQERKLKGEVVYCAMLDFETAFPSVSRNKMYLTLHDQGIQRKKL